MKNIIEYKCLASGSAKSLSEKVNSLMTDTKTPDTQEWIPKGSVSICFNSNSVKYAQAMVLIENQ